MQVLDLLYDQDHAVKVVSLSCLSCILFANLRQSVKQILCYVTRKVIDKYNNKYEQWKNKTWRKYVMTNDTARCKINFIIHNKLIINIFRRIRQNNYKILIKLLLQITKSSHFQLNALFQRNQPSCLLFNTLYTFSITLLD